MDKRSFFKTMENVKKTQRYKACNNRSKNELFIARNVFTKEINKISLSANDDQRIQLIGSIETLHMEQANNQNVKRKK